MTHNAVASKVKTADDVALKALRRAAKDARVTARRFGTPLWIIKRGKIVAVKP